MFIQIVVEREKFHESRLPLRCYWSDWHTLKNSVWSQFAREWKKRYLGDGPISSLSKEPAAAAFSISVLGECEKIIFIPHSDLTIRVWIGVRAWANTIEYVHLETKFLTARSSGVPASTAGVSERGKEKSNSV